MQEGIGRVSYDIIHGDKMPTKVSNINERGTAVEQLPLSEIFNNHDH